MKKISVIVPVYCEEGSLHIFFERLSSVIESMPNYSWDCIFVNDGSTDGSLSILSGLAALNPMCRVLNLSRNFGKEVALTAGITEALHPDAVICLDADLQHPPEVIPKLILEWEQGAEIVATVRKTIDRQPLMRRLGSTIFYWVMRKISDVHMVSQVTDFGLYDKKVIDGFLRVGEHNRMFRGIVDWLGFSRKMIEFSAEGRMAGASSFSYRSLIKLAFDGITSFSLWPLKVSGYLGIGISSICGALLLWMLFSKAGENDGYFSNLAIILVANTFLIGVLLIAIGLIAIYVGRIHTEVINRPLYLVKDRINFPPDGS